MLNLVKICPVAVYLFHADGLKGMTKLMVAFRSRFAQAPALSFFFCASVLVLL
jgi:hypothetical protein